jgi:3-oxoacyl-[acyl-carrier protein] reductase
MISADLTGKKALVTGGASGIGRAISLLLSSCGATVAINHLADDPRGAETQGEINAAGGQAVLAPGSVAEGPDADRMVKQAIDSLGGLDILINNAGTPVTVEPTPFEDLDALDEAFWDKVLNTNLIGPFRCSRAAAPALRESHGCIVNTASIAGLGMVGSSIAYANSKAGLISQTRCLARALSPEIRVNAVAPGLTRTPWTDVWSDERKQGSISNTLLKRMVEPTDIAQGMLFLCAMPAVTGQTIVIDCGRTAP